MICLPNLPFHFRPESEIQAKCFNYMQSPKSGPKKLMNPQSATYCRIQKSVKISLWIQNPGKHIFKIRLSVRLFTPLLLKRIPTSYLPRILIHRGRSEYKKGTSARIFTLLISSTSGNSWIPSWAIARWNNSLIDQAIFSGAQIQREFPLTFRYQFSHLYSFSKPHFISKNASMATFETTLHPRNAIQLVLA